VKGMVRKEGKKGQEEGEEGRRGERRLHIFFD
jgi:hypothetical protein